MVKIECLNLRSGAISSNDYETRKGKSYHFDKGIGTEITDPDDIEFFLNAGGGKSFARTDLIGKAKEIVDKVVDKIVEAATGEKEESISEQIKYTYEELKLMNRKGQAELIRKLGGSSMLIPSREENRIQLILKLQG
ncbi:hypothetical protein HY469_03530 [Candidatus Roizmanbacteria bacterium]|nr:hypothetical protein [Candidatus Roizmanbacteria bacterium]